MARAQRGAGARAPGGARNELRIIGGEWRGRRIQFPPLPALRPSPDRVRETLFNWLAPVIAGARCLDLFAGSGALGLEAASRGATRVLLVDHEPRVYAALAANVARLGAHRAQAQPQVLCADAFRYLDAADEIFDIVFVDPPFGSGMLPRACAALAASARLAPGARVYLECEAGSGAPTLPAGWTLLRSRRAGHVGYHLALATGGAPPAG
jgi:16S rRNA (guanine966-N2)-methyltransferase